MSRRGQAIEAAGDGHHLLLAAQQRVRELASAVDCAAGRLRAYAMGTG